jgi:non-ribosomal peptide synthetase component F
VCLPKSSWSAVALLAVLELGAVYVPLEPRFPVDRIRYVLADCGARVLLTTAGVADTVPVCICDTQSIDPPTPAGRDALGVAPGDPAYIIYTSGSTGEPKGIVQTHACLENLIRWQCDYLPVPPGVRYLQFSPATFDVSLEDVLFALRVGGCLYFPDDETRIDLARLERYVIANAIQALFLPTSVLHALLRCTTTTDCCTC